jgi:hypothetical protein
MARLNADQEEPASIAAKKDTLPETADSPNKPGPTWDGPPTPCTKHHQDGSTKEKSDQCPTNRQLHRGTPHQSSLTLPQGQRKVTPELRSTNRRNPGEGFLNALICAAWIRSGTDDRVYLSLRKSMTIKAYIHAASKRAEIATLLDSGATENFISEDLAYQLRLPITRLHQPRPLFNIDGTKNRKGDITRYTDLEIQTGNKHRPNAVLPH